MSQKLAFIQTVIEANHPFAQICKDFGISRQAGYKTLKRYQQEGENGLLPVSRAPRSTPNKTSPQIEEKIFSLRAKYPTWGARTIHAFLAEQKYNVPCVSTISAILKRNGYIKLEESRKRKAFIRFEREHANDLWQMDFKGKFLLETREWCFPLTIIDDYSRFSLCLKSCANERSDTVFKRLYSVFNEYGLPNQINVDNGNPWGHSSGVRYTPLTIWLMRLGVKVSHSRPWHPQTNGKIERFHRTLKNDLILQNKIQNYKHAQELFNEWRGIYNHVRPHQAIGMLTPDKRYKVSSRSMPDHLPPIEYDDNAIVKKVRGNGGICYKDKEFLVGKAFRGLNLQIKPNEIQKTVEIYFGKNKIFMSTLA
ncbi:MAG: IS481 family transposase [Gammaproteobacteria bacterium]